MSLTATSEAPLGVCVLPAAGMNAPRTLVYGDYIHEILAHAGLCYSRISVDKLSESLAQVRILMTIGEREFEPPLRETLSAWVENGGAWISVSGVCGMGELLGAEVEPPAYSGWAKGVCTLGEGYLKPLEVEHPSLQHLAIPLHFFNGIPVRATSGTVLASVMDVHQRPTQRAALLERQVGRGRCVLIAPDVCGAVVRIQQGVAVTRDGTPAPDGTGSRCDNVLKSDDGLVLDWAFDRQAVEGAPELQGFVQPIADQWRELLLRTIFHVATEQGVVLPLLWLYPRNMPALAHMSHDTDMNEPEKAKQLLDVLRSADIRSTWCTILPGYSDDIMKAIGEAGHEYAMHYDAISEGREWSEAQFIRQHGELTTLFGGRRITTNKNHYLRWEGDTEFFEWCVRRGIELDQSKGPSKTGEAPFTFGTCHPYFPLDPKGCLIDVLELPPETQDLIVFAPPALLEPMLAAAYKHHGILHLLFHPAHIDKPGVAAALLSAVARAKSLGMEWWKAEDINRWERSRRKGQWSDCACGQSETRVRFQAGDTPLPDATLLFLVPTAPASDSHCTLRISSVEQSATVVKRWGFSFRSCVVGGSAGESLDIDLQIL